MKGDTVHRIWGSEDTAFSESSGGWTVAPDYWYDVNDQVIRLVANFDRVLAAVGGPDHVLNLLYDGEAELRIGKSIPYDCIEAIEIVDAFFNRDIEDDFGVNRAIQAWFPNEYRGKLKLVRGTLQQASKSRLCRELADYYKLEFEKRGMQVKKPEGWNLSGNKFFGRKESRKISPSPRFGMGDDM